MNTTITVTETAVNDLLSIKQTLMYSAKEYGTRTKIRVALNEATTNIQHLVWALMGGDETAIIGWHEHAMKAVTRATMANTTSEVIAEELLVAYRILTESVTIAAMTETAK